MKINVIDSNVDIIKEIGKRIKRQRINISLTQQELADKTGVSLRTICNVENGRDTKLSVIISVLRALNILSNIDLLIEEETIRPSDYLKLNKPRERVVNKKGDVNNGWSWR